MKTLRRGCWLALLLGAIAGCSSKTPEKAETAEAGAKGEDHSTHDHSHDDAPKPFIAKDIATRPTLEGRWLLLFYGPRPGIEVPVALLDISKGEKPNELKVVPRQFGITIANPQVRKAEATADKLQLDFEITIPNPQQQQPQATKALAQVDLDFKEGRAKGSAQLAPTVSFAAMMIPSDLETLQELRPIQLPETAELQQNAKGDLNQTALDFVKSHPDSPLSLDLFPAVERGFKERATDEKAVKEIVDLHVGASRRWNSRMELKARIAIATALLSQQIMPTLTIEQVDAALSLLDAETTAANKPTLEAMKETAGAVQALKLIQSGSPDEKKKAADVLRGRHERQPFEPSVIQALARYEEAAGKKDAALDLYGKIAVLPFLENALDSHAKAEKLERPTARASAEKLWKELHSKSDGLEQHLAAVYDKSMPKLEAQPVKPRSANSANRVILCELFTGVSCPACVAANVAFDHLAQTYEPTELITLQYHLHVPTSDPLTNEDTQTRFAYYTPEDQRSCPTFAISGNVAQGLSGLLEKSSFVYQSLRSFANTLLTKASPIQLRVKAERDGDKIKITADGEGVFPADQPIRLRLALAEDTVNVTGKNGLRRHHMVVRSMPGGPVGVGAKEGKFHYEGTTDLKTVKQQLEDHLEAHEAKAKEKFAAKPMDFANLRVVAFVQNDATKEVYQAAMAAVPDASKADAKKPETQASAAPAAAPAPPKK